MKQTHIPYGLISGIAMAVVGMILYVTGLSFSPSMRYISYIPFAIGIILNAIAFSKANDHYVTFGQVFSSGFRASAIVALVTLLWAIIILMFLPDFKETGLQSVQAEMEKNPKLDEDAINMAMSYTRKYWNIMMIGGSIFIPLFWGAILSLIGAAIAKKKGERMPPPQVI